jgi:ribosomal protein S18 acetylase RimI-like enzyme
VIELASVEDIAYLARGFAGVAEHLKRIPDNPFVRELRSDSDSSRSIARSFVHDPDRFAFVATHEDERVGCVAAQIGPCSVDWAALSVGNIVCCWVEPHARRQSFGRRLTTAAEAECQRRGVAYVELAYVADNAGAAAAWARLGYEPHRVFALKQLGS